MPLFWKGRKTSDQSAEEARKVEEARREHDNDRKWLRKEIDWQGPIPTKAQRFPKTQREEAKVQSQAIPKVEQLLPEAQGEKEEGQAPAIPKIKALLTETHEYV